MHHARVQLHLTFFVRQSPVAHRVITRIVFHQSHCSHRRVQRVAAALQNVHAFLQRFHTIRAGNNDWTLAFCRACLQTRGHRLWPNSHWSFRSQKSRRTRCRSRQRCQKKSAPRPKTHASPSKTKVIARRHYTSRKGNCKGGNSRYQFAGFLLLSSASAARFPRYTLSATPWPEYPPKTTTFVLLGCRRNTGTNFLVIRIGPPQRCVTFMFFMAG